MIRSIECTHDAVSGNGSTLGICTEQNSNTISIPPVAGVNPWRSRIRLISTFILGQCLSQAIGMTAGFLLLRWLSVQDYARFSLAFGFQALMTSLIDIGVSGAVVNLVGTRGCDKALVSDYIAATRWLRNRLFLILTPLGAFAFHQFANKYNWSTTDQVILFGSIVLTIYLQTTSASYTALLLLHKRLSEYYRIAAISASSRLALIGAVYFLSTLSAGVVYIVTTGTTALSAVLAYRVVRNLLSAHSRATPEVRRELLRYIGPLAPGVIFFAFQGQITIFLMSLFGSTQNVAETGALGRLGLLFGTLSALNGAVISPYFARLPATVVVQRYAVALAVAVLGSFILVVFAFLWPEPLLWLLGPRYLHMQKEAAWTVLGSSFGFIGALMYGIHLARQWVFWWSSLSTITAVVSVQAWMLWCHPIDSTLSVAIFGAVTSATMIAVQIFVAIRGMCLTRTTGSRYA